MSDVFEKYKKVQRVGTHGGPPTESEVRKALRVRASLIGVAILLVLIALAGVYTFFPVVFWIAARIVTCAALAIGSIYGMSKLLDLIWDTAETLRQAKARGVVEDE